MLPLKVSHLFQLVCFFIIAKDFDLCRFIFLITCWFCRSRMLTRDFVLKPFCYFCCDLKEISAFYKHLPLVGLLFNIFHLFFLCDRNITEIFIVQMFYSIPNYYRNFQRFYSKFSFGLMKECFSWFIYLFLRQHFPSIKITFFRKLFR